MATRNYKAFTLLELLLVVVIVGVLAAVTAVAAQQALLTASLATSGNNIRQLAAGSAAYLADHNHVFWRWSAESTDPQKPGVIWWYGFEPQHSRFSLPEGERYLEAESGPLAGYVPLGASADPSFRYIGKPFKPKYRHGYIGVAYNAVLGGGMLTKEEPSTPLINSLQLEKPGEVVVFATSAQVNTFQRPASGKNPMIEEFYGIDQNQVTVHFRHRGRAMVAFANGSVGFLEIDETTRDKRDPKANVGRFAPVGDFRYLR